MPKPKPVNTDKQVAGLRPGGSKYTVRVKGCPGLFVRVAPTGGKSFVAVATNPVRKKQEWSTIGGIEWSIDEVREEARNRIKRIKAGQKPVEDAPTLPDSYEAVTENFLKRYVAKLRTKGEIERVFRRYVLPEWKGRAFVDIRRGDITRLLDRIEDEHGARTADYVLAVTRKLANWHTSRNDDYESPFVRDMRRQSDKDSQRARVLDDDEIRAVWKAAGVSGAFGGIVQMALLTAQRRGAVASMRWDDLSFNGETVTWTIPQEDDREKGNGGTLRLPAMARAVVDEQPRRSGNGYVFAGRHDGHFVGWANGKRLINAKVGDIPRWTIHDLRRTARSLMSRAGVRPDIAEHVMGHKRPGVEGRYDKHEYIDEKAEALKKLAGLLDIILKNNPSGENVVQMRTAAECTTTITGHTRR